MRHSRARRRSSEMPAVARGISRRTELIYREYMAARAELPGITEREILQMLQRQRPKLNINSLRLAIKRTKALIDAGQLPADEEPIELDEDEEMAA